MNKSLLCKIFCLLALGLGQVSSVVGAQHPAGAQHPMGAPDPRWVELNKRFPLDPQMARRQRRNHLKAYKPTRFEKATAWCYDKSSSFHNFISPAQPKKESFFRKLIKAPFKVGKIIFSPLSWLNEKINPFIDRKVHQKTYQVLQNIEMPKNSPLRNDPMMQNFVAEQTRIVAPMIASKPKQWTTQLINFGARYFLNLLVPLEGLPEWNPMRPHIYKNALVQRLLEEFEDKLPQQLQNGRAYQGYLAGKDICGIGNLIYTLADNITHITALMYQLTNYAELKGHAPTRHIPMTTLKKCIMIFDIAGRCADCYIEVVKHLNLNSYESATLRNINPNHPEWTNKIKEKMQNTHNMLTTSPILQKINSALKWLASTSKLLCPWREHLVGTWEAGKLAYFVYDMYKMPKREMVKYLREKYGMRLFDAQDLYNASQKMQRRGMTLAQVKECEAEVNTILAKYNITMDQLTCDLAKRDPRMQKLRALFIRKYRMSEIDADQIIIAMVQDDQDAANSVLKKYHMSYLFFDRDPDIRNILSGEKRKVVPGAPRRARL